jgi:hypothetical protein
LNETTELGRGSLLTPLFERLPKRLRFVEKKSALTNLCLVSIHRIAEGNFYEAHQQLRVITSRYLKSSDYTSACDVLYNGALLLLRAGQGGSGGDLAMMLLNEVYNKGEFVCNDTNKKRLFEILHAFPPDEPTRKRFVTETVGWSGRFGELERGDPEVQDQVGRVFASGTCVCEKGARHSNPLGRKTDQPPPD